MASPMTMVGSTPSVSSTPRPRLTDCQNARSDAAEWDHDRKACRANRGLNSSPQDDGRHRLAMYAARLEHDGNKNSVESVLQSLSQ